MTTQRPGASGGSGLRALGRRARTLLATGASFDPARANNLDLARFVAATLVLVDHSFVLTGRPGHPGPFRYETLGGFAVATFFVISGFLVAASWQRRPSLLAFARKRALRILPAYVAVVALCALLLGPLLTPLPLSQYFNHPQTWAYFANLTFTELHFNLPLVFAANPYPHAVNGSIWTLPIEMTMYVALALLGASRLFNRATVTVIVAGLALAWFGWADALNAAPPLGLAALPTGYTVHLALWFFAGAAFWFWRDRIRYRADVAFALALACGLSTGTSGGSVLFHIALPYMLLTFATLDVAWMAHFGQRGDFSYGIYLWAFPVQQTLVHLGGASWPLPVFVAASFAATLACAVVSWHAVEGPALRHKRSALRAGHLPAAQTLAS